MKKGIATKLADLLIGHPAVHKPEVRMNRKQKRSQSRVIRKRMAAKNRKKYERRD